MNVRPNPGYAEFVYRIRRLSAAPARRAGLTFRSVELERASSGEILSGEGSQRFAGRWNAPGTFPVIYSSTRPGTAIEEASMISAILCPFAPVEGGVKRRSSSSDKIGRCGSDMNVAGFMG